MKDCGGMKIGKAHELTVGVKKALGYHEGAVAGWRMRVKPAIPVMAKKRAL